MIDTLNLVVRQLVRAVLGMPSGSVRPADQIAPAGGQTAAYATVKIISCEGVGWAETRVVSDGAGAYNEELQLPERFTASVNFYGTSAADAAHVALFSNEAFDRASTLMLRLQRSRSVALMAQIGIGLLRGSQARNLAGIGDTIWQSRGQVDLTFNVVNRDITPIGTIESVPLTVITKGSAVLPQTKTFEVTT